MRRIILATLAAVGVMAVVWAIGTVGTGAQQGQDGASLEVRVVAHPHDDGTVEFAVEYDGERYLPTGRRLSPALADSRRGQWLTSTPVELVGPSSRPAVLEGGDEYRDVEGLWETAGFGRPIEELRVRAKPLVDGRIEFGLNHNGQVLLPDLRYLTPRLIEERAGEWLRSSPVEVTSDVVPAEWVRRYSAEWYSRSLSDDRTGWHWGWAPIDIARSCSLDALTLLQLPPHDPYDWWDEVKGGLEADFPDIPHRVVDNDGYGGPPPFRLELFSSEGKWIHSEERFADRYGFLIEDPRFGKPVVWWMAEFACGGEAPTGNVEPADQGGGGTLE